MLGWLLLICIVILVALVYTGAISFTKPEPTKEEWVIVHNANASSAMVLVHRRAPFASLIRPAGKISKEALITEDSGYKNSAQYQDMNKSDYMLALMNFKMNGNWIVPSATIKLLDALDKEVFVKEVTF
jgi:hypothetical protein